MSIKIRQQLVTSDKRVWAGTSKIEGITIHETANTSRGANAAAHANLQSNGNVRAASWHYQVDDKEIVQSFRDEQMCQHAGWGARNHIAIEICVNSDGDYNKAVANAAKLVAHLRKKHGLGRNTVKQHFHHTGKNCPSRMRLSGDWSKFVAATDPGGKNAAPKPGNNDKAAASGGGRSVAAMAKEILAGKHGNGHAARRKSLGISAALYEQVRAEVNRRAGGGSSSRPAPAKKKSGYTGGSIVDYLASIGQPTSLAHRRKLAARYGISNYTGSAAQNTLLLNKLRGGKPTPTRRKTVNQVVTEIIKGTGDWGNNPGRARKLRAAGYNPAQVQRLVNQRLK